jgi:hypothetical protein
LRPDIQYRARQPIADFPSAVHAVQCAVAVQDAIGKENRDPIGGRVDAVFASVSISTK